MPASIHFFAQALLDLGNKIHNLSSDTLKLGICSGSLPDGVNTLAPHWGGTGTTNLASSQVTTAGTSYTGPKTLTSVTWTIVGPGAGVPIGVPTLRAADISLALDASGFTNGTYGVIYNDTDANKRAIGYIDFGGAKSLASDSLVMDWQGAGTDILTLTAG